MRDILQYVINNAKNGIYETKTSTYKYFIQVEDKFIYIDICYDPNVKFDAITDDNDKHKLFIWITIPANEEHEFQEWLKLYCA